MSGPETIKTRGASISKGVYTPPTHTHGMVLFPFPSDNYEPPLRFLQTPGMLGHWRKLACNVLVSGATQELGRLLLWGRWMRYSPCIPELHGFTKPPDPQGPCSSRILVLTSDSYFQGNYSSLVFGWELPSTWWAFQPPSSFWANFYLQIAEAMGPTYWKNQSKVDFPSFRSRISFVCLEIIPRAWPRVQH